ncbi:MAG TPA: hypothetical protein VFB32_11410 [Rudaea sp.]|jgi:hypothetical protein|nr:hypothetical protein [Rudaea sp.]
MDAIAAERTFFAVAPDGSGHDAALRISVPIRQRACEWHAVVTLPGLDEGRYAIAGVDAWQAIRLAMRFSATRIHRFVDDGWQFYWERDGLPAAPAELAG